MWNKRIVSLESRRLGIRSTAVGSVWAQVAMLGLTGCLARPEGRLLTTSQKTEVDEQVSRYISRGERDSRPRQPCLSEPERA